MQEGLGPAVAPAKAVVADQMLVEVLRRETLVALPIELLHPHRPIHRHPLRRRLAKPPIVQPLETLFLMPLIPAPESPFAHPQDLSSLGLAQLAARPAPPHRLELHPSQSLQHLCPSHPRPLVWSNSKTGQIVCYKNRTYRVLSTAASQHMEPFLLTI